MEKEFILYDQALDLKELGFDDPCLAIYNKKGEFSTVGDLRCPYTYLNNTHPIHKHENGVICIPLYRQAFRWFDKNYGLIFNIVGSGPYYPSVANSKIDGDSNIELVECEIYEEAEIICLKKMISIAK